jgi:hypothetical protein
MKPLILWGSCWVLLLSATHGQEPSPDPPSAAPHQVGALGHSEAITFEGNASFTSDVLRRALTRDIDYVLASHVLERLDQFLPVIAGRLRQGYRNSGFPAAKVEARYRIVEKHGGILVSISEGPRYRQGAIRVEGDTAILPAKLVEALRKRTDKDSGSYADRVRELMESHEDDLPSSEEHSSSRTSFEEFLLSGQDGPAWEPGEPCTFGEDNESPLILPVMSCLAGQARPLAKVTTRYEFNPDGTADLMIHITDAGPVTTVGQVTVEGHERSAAEAIARLSGLEPGQAVTPDLLDEAQLALWRSGRFFPFAIDMRPRGEGSREVDFHIRVREIEDVPPLSTPPTRDQEVVVRFLDWLNSGLPGEDLLFEREDPELGNLLVGWAPHECVMVNLITSKNSAGVSALLSIEGASITLRHADRAQAARFPGISRNLLGTLHILPSLNEKSKLRINAGIGFSTKTRGDFLNLDLLFTPAYAFLKSNEIRSTSDRVILSPAIIPYSIELDAATARPVAATRGKTICKIVTTTGAVRERQRQLEAELATQVAGSTPTGWSDAFAGLLKECTTAEGQGIFTAEAIEAAHNHVRRVELLAKPEVLNAFKKLCSDLTAGMGSTSEFTIPVNPEPKELSPTMALLLGFGYLGLIEDYLPEAEWIGTFAREMMFILGGKTQHSAEVMSALLADPAIGPCGSFFCAELLDEIDPITARRFRMKARAQCSAEEFRKDWKLLADSSGPVGRGFHRCLETLSSFSAEDEATASGLLPKEMTAWLPPFLGKLRQHESGKPWSDLIAPQMDKLWDDVLSVRMLSELDRRLPPPVDPAEMAAIIDEVPVPRHVVQILEQQRLDPLLALSVSGLDASRPWTRDPALAGAIRMIMIRNSMQQAGRYPTEEAIEEFLTQGFPHLAGKPDEDWIRQTGLKRADFGQWAALAGCTQQLLVDLRSDQPEAPDDATLRNYYEARATIYGRSVDTHMILIRSHEGTPAEVSRCFRRAEQLANLLGAGKTVADLEASGELEKEPAAEAFSREDVSLDSYQFPVMKAIASLKPGEVSQALEVAGGVAIVVMRASRQTEPPDFDAVKDSVLEHWRDEEVVNHARRWFEEHEAAATIQILEAPRGAPASE